MALGAHVRVAAQHAQRGGSRRRARPGGGAQLQQRRRPRRSSSAVPSMPTCHAAPSRRAWQGSERRPPAAARGRASHRACSVAQPLLPACCCSLADVVPDHQDAQGPALLVGAVHVVRIHVQKGLDARIFDVPLQRAGPIDVRVSPAVAGAPPGGWRAGTAGYTRPGLAGVRLQASAGSPALLMRRAAVPTRGMVRRRQSAWRFNSWKVTSTRQSLCARVASGVV